MKNRFQYIKENYKLILVVFIVGLIVGWIFFHSSGEATKANQGIENHEGHAHESEDPTTWTCSMHPQIKQDKPGLCPICAMDLIPLTSMQAEGDNVDPNEIMMSESAAKLADIQTMVVSKGAAIKQIQLQGKVQADERNISKLTARYGGRIEKLFVNFTGQEVSKGEKLASIYSPDLVTAQRELLEAISFKDTRPSLYTAAKGKLRLWNISEKQIEAIEKKGEPQMYFDILAPISGTVSHRQVAIGDYVKEGSALFEVIDLTKMWVLFDAYESDLPWIKLGDKVDFSIQSLPGKKFTSKVSYIDPFINGQTRVTKVRVEVPNKEGLLKPEMFTSAVLESQIAGTEEYILIPKSSFLWTGKRAVVYVKLSERESPTFLYREIVLGPEAGAFYVVAAGLEEGEEIAVNGVFKIDAASQLQGLPSMMNPEGGVVSSGHNHGEQTSKKEEDNRQEAPLNERIITKAETPQAFKNQLSELAKKYIQLKEALVETDENRAKKEAQKALDALLEVDMSLLNNEAHLLWMPMQKTMHDNLKGIIKMEGIEMKRQHFSPVSENLYLALKSFGSTAEQTVYLQFCPMAFDNLGAFWISDEKQIRNPYFGDMMLKCGEVKDSILGEKQ